MSTYPYVPQKPPLPESADRLRSRIPGWGADLDPADRPSVPRERFDPGATGAHWELPERQPEDRPRERSIEHGELPPVFGTTCPTRGLSGAIRRLAYARYSEARAAHWLLLIGADRVDVVESTLRSWGTGHPDVPFVPSGLRAELTHHGLRSRLGRRRTDVAHHLLDPAVVAGPWLAAGYAAYRIARVARGPRGTSPHDLPR
ncbi:MAG TPA: hypothetical protein VD864_18980 [Nocardioides sp.]|nr:hypothetical protein [Nocardioides sp.]